MPGAFFESRYPMQEGWHYWDCNKRNKQNEELWDCIEKYGMVVKTRRGVRTCFIYLGKYKIKKYILWKLNSEGEQLKVKRQEKSFKNYKLTGRYYPKIVIS